MKGIDTQRKKPRNPTPDDREEAYRFLLKNSTDAIFITNPDGKIRTANSAACRMFGFPEQDLQGIGWDVLVDKDDPEIQRAFEERERTGRYAGEVTLKKKDGTRFSGWLATALFAGSAGPKEAVVLVRDLASRRFAEKGLHGNEEHSYLLIQQVKDYAIFALNADGRVIDWNLGAQHITGYREEEIIGKHFSVFYTEDDIEWRKPWRILEIASTEGQFKEEGWRVHKDGSRFWADVVVTALRDEMGTVQGFMNLTRDITERRQVEQALNHRLAMDELVAAISNRFINIPPSEVDGEIMHSLQIVREFARADRTYLCLVSGSDAVVNRVYESYAEGIVPRTIDLEGVPFASFHWVHSKFKRSQTVCVFDISALPVDANAEREFWQKGSIQALVAIPLTSRNSLVGFLTLNSVQEGRKWTAADIRLIKLVGNIFLNALERWQAEKDRLKAAADILEAERRESEARLRENERWASMGQMASGIAHDIRNAINFVSLSLDHLSAKKRTGEDAHRQARNLVNDAHAELVRISEMIQGLLDFGRPQAPSLVEVEKVAHIVSESRAEVVRRRPGAEHCIRLEGIDDKASVRADRSLLQRAIVNLLENGLEAAGPDGTVRVDVTRKAGKGKPVVIGIEDSGEGIAPDDMAKIFTPYYTTKNSGIGLGLTLVKKWVEGMGGTIRVSGAPGGGARFELEFTATDNEPAAREA